MKTIGIFMAGQQGDQISALSVMKYRYELWGNCKIVWYSDKINFDNFKFQDIEVREFPRGFGYPDMVETENNMRSQLLWPDRKSLWEDWKPLVDWDNRMNVALKHNYPSLADIDIGYFPAPHQLTPQQRHGLEYPNVSKKVFGVPQEWEWHPVIDFSEEELIAAEQTMRLMDGKKIAIETFGGSGQSILNDAQVRKAMEICEEILGKCSFVFASHKYLKNNDEFPEYIVNRKDVFFLGWPFTVRQCGLIVSKCDLLLSVSSGITVAASAWQLNPTPILQYCGSSICSTRAMALGRFELITTDDNPLAESQYYGTLEKLLIEIK